MNKELYISLIARQLSNELNSSQLQNLNSWLSKGKDNANLLDEFKQTWNATASYKQSIAIDVDSAFSSFADKFNIPTTSNAITESPKTASNTKRNSLIALLLLMLFSLGYLFTSLTSNKVSNTNMQALTTYVDESAEITLSPNSTYKLVSSNTLTENINEKLTAILNSNIPNNSNDYFSSVEFSGALTSEDFSIEALSGQAFIDLNDDDFKIFGLNGGQFIAAKDASFNVQNYKDDHTTVIDVQSGKVLFAHDNNVFVINEGQRAIFDKKAQRLVKADSPAINPFKWHKGILVFDNTPLEEAFTLLERFYGVDIQVNNKSDLSNKNFTATFPISSNLNDCLELINASFEMDIEKVDNRTIKINDIKG